MSVCVQLLFPRQWGVILRRIKRQISNHSGLMLSGPMCLPRDLLSERDALHSCLAGVQGPSLLSSKLALQDCLSDDLTVISRIQTSRQRQTINAGKIRPQYFYNTNEHFSLCSHSLQQY